MKHKLWISTFVGSCVLVGCGDDSSSTEGTTDGTGSTTMPATTSTTTMTADESSTAGTTTATGTGTTMDPDSSSSGTTAGPEPEPATFTVTIENISANSMLPTGISPGFWIEQAFGSTPVFTTNTADIGAGLEALAEDGDVSTLATSLMTATGVLQSGTYPDPLAALAPGDSTQFTFTADPGSRLSIGSMFGESNDVFVGTGPLGIALFDNAGFPLSGVRNFSQSLILYDAGTEANQAPGQGSWQAPRQAAPDTGETDGATVNVTAFSHSTHALPQALAFLDVTSITRDAKTGEVTIVLENISDTRGTAVTDLSDMIYVLHDDSFSLFEPGGSAASYAGMESLAEDGDPADWIAALDGASGVAEVGEIPGTEPGESFTIIVTPTMDAPRLSFATMVGQSNDAFISTWPSGANGGAVLMDSAGAPATEASIDAYLNRWMGVWDAGTEANAIPGLGLNQAPRQLSDNSGAADSNTEIRPYLDATNDFATANNIVEVTVEEGAQPDEVDITITNVSDDAGVPLQLSHVLHIMHDGTTTLFDVDAPASTALESLAEDGDPDALLTEFQGIGGVTAAVEDGGTPGSNLAPGDSYTFTVTVPDADTYFNFAMMVVHSNDAFVAFSPGGIQIADVDGRLEEATMQTAANAALAIWDAGTEGNQAGARGGDQPLRQTNPGDGPPEGAAVVREASADPIWVYPDPPTILNVTFENVQK